MSPSSPSASAHLSATLRVCILDYTVLHFRWDCLCLGLRLYVSIVWITEAAWTGFFCLLFRSTTNSSSKMLPNGKGKSWVLKAQTTPPRSWGKIYTFGLTTQGPPWSGFNITSPHSLSLKGFAVLGIPCLHGSSPICLEQTPFIPMPGSYPGRHTKLTKETNKQKKQMRYYW